MDKYEFNIKVEQIKKLVNKGDFETAMKIADTIDWRRVRSTSLLTMISQIYEKNAEYQDAKDILLLAYERAPLGKGLLYKLTDLALRENNIQEAEAYYREFCELSGDDPRQYLLRFLILEAKDAPLEQQINSLERYCQEELDEKWLYHLAELYHQANQADDCVRICDKIMLMFGLGKYVDKAMELKLQYAPLTKYQMDLVENREKYEEKLRAVEEEYKNGTYRKPEPEGEYLDSEEIYQALTAYIIDYLSTDTGFSKLLYKYMLQEDTISGQEICLVLYEQGVLDKNDDDYENLASGAMGAYDFMINKIANLEIEPAQLALAPCSASAVITDVKTGKVLACVSYPGQAQQQYGYQLLYKACSGSVESVLQ